MKANRPKTAIQHPHLTPICSPSQVPSAMPQAEQGQESPVSPPPSSGSITTHTTPLTPALKCLWPAAPPSPRHADRGHLTSLACFSCLQHLDLFSTVKLKHHARLATAPAPNKKTHRSAQGGAGMPRAVLVESKRHQCELTSSSLQTRGSHRETRTQVFRGACTGLPCCLPEGPRATTPQDQLRRAPRSCF